MKKISHWNIVHIFSYEIINQQTTERYCHGESVDKLEKRNHNLGRFWLFRCHLLEGIFVIYPNDRYIWIYHNWLQQLYLKKSVTAVSVIDLIILFRLQKRYCTLKPCWTIAALSSSMLLPRHIQVKHTECSFEKSVHVHTLWKHWGNS